MLRRLFLVALAASISIASPAWAQMHRPKQQEAPKRNGPLPPFPKPEHPGELPPDMMVENRNFPTGATWRLTELNGRPVPSGVYATLLVDPTYRASGDAGCNTFSTAMYPQADKHLATGPMAVTRRQCDKGVMTFEQAYLVALHSGPTWAEQQGYLVLKTPATTLRFARGF